MKNENQTICFAYYGDGKFLGWYADSHGSIRPNSPKLYGNSDKQIQIISENFKYKMSKLQEVSTISESDSRFAILDNSLNKDKSDLSHYEYVELRGFLCPEYDGPNPNFDKSAYEAQRTKRHADMEAQGIFNIPAPSKERSEAVEAYNSINAEPKCDNWIYADYTKVKEWASKEPIEQPCRIITA